MILIQRAVSIRLQPFFMRCHAANLDGRDRPFWLEGDAINDMWGDYEDHPLWLIGRICRLENSVTEQNLAK
jgi:hypothetical protein